MSSPYTICGFGAPLAASSLPLYRSIRAAAILVHAYINGKTCPYLAFFSEADDLSVSRMGREMAFSRLLEGTELVDTLKVDYR